MKLTGGELERVAPKQREQAAVALIGSHEKTFRRTARRHSLCAEDADDAYQRAVEILLTKAPTADPTQLIRWMQTVTKHEAMAVRRQRERLFGPPMPGDETPPGSADSLDLLPSDRLGPTERAERGERIARSREALAALKPQEVKALVLKAEGYSYEEIGGITGWSYTKINRCMAEGRRRFLEVYASIEEGRRCEELAGALSAYCDGESSGPAAESVRLHLRACGHCRAKMRAYRGLPRRVLELLPAEILIRPWWARAQEWAAGIAGNRQPAMAKAQQLAEAAWAQKAAVAVSVAAVAAGGGAAIRAERSDRSPPPPRAPRPIARPDPRPLVDAVVKAVPDQRPGTDRGSSTGGDPSNGSARPEPTTYTPPQEAVGSPGSTSSASGSPPSRPPPSQVPDGGGQEFGP